ncbi:MAG TPA: holo-ACP synthase [Bacillota bacterium]|nr:holo-ACP synthase [Bacillota bacterium]HPF42867.1 holo-ACP synthase [Bacillota bacterium]HPJ86099.1 holo-ACP synthase [Bacillota bacterium]HPQ61496.1 holo-ACP synthase [Bacillota bacterium]HRX92065.1 holo-ACP synthase [Candidatus Izemoplasmatales bacterium]
MITGIGTDIVRIDRIKEDMIDMILSGEERKMYETFGSEKRRREFLAGRFAAKEALTKALSSVGLVATFRETIIINDENGQPVLKYPSWPEHNIHLSISHENDYATAVCVLETKDM